MRDTTERIFDMLEAIGRIERYSEKGRAAFEKDELIQTWIVHHIEVIGEAASRLGQDFHNAYREIPWPQIIAMRNIIAHEYFGIDLDEVWQVVEKDLPKLKQQLNGIHAELVKRETHH
jgi:uncharacterized protein with HEPN domain